MTGMSGMNGAQALIRTLTGAGVQVCFSNPGTSEMHFVAALDAVPQMRGVLCLFEGTATGAADGYGRMTGRPGRGAAAPRAGPGQRAGQPAQRAARGHPPGHRGGRPRDLAQALRRTAGVRHRRAGRVGVRLGPALAAQRGCGRRRGRRGGGGLGRHDRHAHPARRRVLVRTRRTGPGAPGPPAVTGPGRRDRGRGEGAAQRRAVPDPAGRDRGAAPRPGGGQPDRRGDRREAAVRDVPGPAGTRRRAPGHRAAGLPGRDGGRAARGHPPSDPGRGEGAGQLLRLPGHAQLAGAGRVRGAHAGDEGRRRARRAGGARGPGRGGHRGPGPGRRSGPGSRTGP